MKKIENIHNRDLVTNVIAIFEWSQTFEPLIDPFALWSW